MKSWLRSGFAPAHQRVGHTAGALLPALSAAVLLAVAACGDRVSGPSDRPQQLLFLSHADGVMPPAYRATDIHRINADGTGAENLTQFPAQYTSLTLSPDGRTVAFQSDRSGRARIWAMNVDGTTLRPLTEQHSSYAPRWSPDGTRIAFEMTSHVDGEPSVQVMDANGANPRDVSSAALAADAACGEPPRLRLELIGWSPDGRVLFSNYVCGEGYRRYIVNADGSNAARYDADFYSEFWSPDGSKVAFTSSQKLFVMNADGSGARALTQHAGADILPSRQLLRHRTDYSPWSPDGSHIVFQNSRQSGTAGSEHSVNVINADGSGLLQLADFTGEFNGWSADGSRIAFTRLKDGAYDVYVINADGTGVRNLTGSIPGDQTSALWLPRR